ncbi:hypothetical protein GOBAR_AA16936 [Gossypium barbadense]|uniref:Small EDRK-rich factor-like N-terminal domain-containing protein n=1 Tax=Gossypium barbadense TaxID=3634 RepID=A0A2P5XK85_GOSBA|nr:hypothetical protein GOBAR_AA16936 [Gossypium barbadense]
MGGGNGQKSKMAREKNLEKQKAAAKGSQLESNKKAMSIQGDRSLQSDIKSLSSESRELEVIGSHSWSASL